MEVLALLALAGFAGGIMNAIAGGGSFVTMPALIAAGVPSVAANMTSTVALCPGSFASAFAYRKDFRRFGQASVSMLLAVSLVGGGTGALLLIFTPSDAFDLIVPWLLLLGSVAFAFGKRIGVLVSRFIRLDLAALLVAQFLLGVYGGYFGGAVGLMMLAVWTIFGSDDLIAMTATRTVLVGAANAVAIAFFVFAGDIFWREALVMMAAAIAGGYAGARIARRVAVQRLRVGIAALNFAVTAVFFWRSFS